MKCQAETLSLGKQIAERRKELDISQADLAEMSGVSGIKDAMEMNCDAFVTGSIKEEIPIFCQECGVNLAACGHHRTETFGVRALAEKIEKELSIPSKFIDFDNPV